MVRILRCCVLLHMATGAVGADRRVVAPDMTGRALHVRVRSSKWEFCQVVVESRRLPGSRRVADLAGRGNP